MEKQIGSISIIAVRDVEKTSKVLSGLFGWKSTHGGPHFDILVTESNTPALLLHEHNAHDHKRFKDIDHKPIGIGQSQYVFVSDIDAVHDKVLKDKFEIIEPMWLNENTETREFTFRITEGHQFSVCQGHRWLYHNI